MNKTIFSFTITSIAGLSTLLGLIPCLMKGKSKESTISFSLAFSAGVMLVISLISLIPESLQLYTKVLKLTPATIILAISIVVGIIFSMTIDQTIEKHITNNNLYKLGLISIIALVLHNIPEGITTFISSSINTKLGIMLAISIALHNIPEGISIAIPIYYSTNKFSKAFFYTLISGFSELLVAVLAYLFLAKYINNFTLGLILATTAGIMIHISIYELLPNAFTYNKNKVAITALIIGAITMLLCTLIL